jgi:hypothetical protein
MLMSTSSKLLKKLEGYKIGLAKVNSDSDKATKYRKKILSIEARLASLGVAETKAPEPVVEESAPEPVEEIAASVEIAEVVAEEPTPVAPAKPKRRYRRRKATKAKE